MVECLRPGGWLLDEDGDWGVVAPIDSSHPHYALYHRVWKNGNGGYHADTTQRLDESCRCCSNAAA
jgi:hypothetical protein